jgi:hypothetical protein
MLDVFVAAERAVYAACKFLGMNEADARKLVRGEINRDTFDEIRSTLGRDSYFDYGNMMRRTAPLVHRGVSFYLIENLEAPWRVIGLGQVTGGCPCATVVEGKADAEVG